MQKTRQQILDILNQHGKATVNDIVEALQKIRGDNITAVTVRHHLNLLQKEELIASPEIKHATRPGRPQHIYILTNKAKEYFPHNYGSFTKTMIEELRRQLPPPAVNVIFDGIASNMAQEANIPDLPISERLDLVAEYLNEHGYSAEWEITEETLILHTSNCPYHEISHENDALCYMDMRLVSLLVGSVPRRISQISNGEATCSYAFPQPRMG